jgi:SEC-C motif-containing protein
MRSRYAAYVLGDIDHIVRTQDAGDGDVDREAIERFSRDSEWLGLEIVATERGGEDDDAGTVEFVARYRDKSGVQRHHERSRFERRDGRWLFVEGAPVKPPPARRAVTAGRNDPCPCGSGKKYKRCHGA